MVSCWKLPFLLFLVTLNSGLARDVQITKLLNLEIYEPYVTHLVHNGHVFVGQSKAGKITSPRIEIFNVAGKHHQTITLAYTPTHIFPHGVDQVVITGKTSSPHWRTFYSVLSKNSSNSFLIKTYEFPEKYQIDHFAGDGKRLFFALFGDRSILEKRPGAWSFANAEDVIGPNAMSLVGNDLFVINVHHILHSGHETLSHLDLANGKVTLLTPTFRRGMKNLLYHKRTSLLVATERLENQVLLFEPKSKSLISTFRVPIESPEAIAEYGSCLAIGGFESRKVLFYDLKSRDPEPIDEWDLSKVGTTFRHLNAMGIDLQTGRLFARSTLICTGCKETMSSVIMAEAPDTLLRERCLRGTYE